MMSPPFGSRPNERGLDRTPGAKFTGRADFKIPIAKMMRFF